MATIILGGGLIGVTTAYYLAKSGRDVTVIERNSGVGEETSFQNGALLAPGHSQAWAAPGATWTLIKSLFQKDPALKFRLSSDPQFWRWGMKFLGFCTAEHYRTNSLRVFRCMNAGMMELRELAQSTGIDYDANDNGILYLFRSDESLKARQDDWTILQDQGLRLEKADVSKCVEIEPTLEPVAHQIGGGFYSPDEGAGDAYVFTCALAKHCEDLGVTFKYETHIERLHKERGSISGVETNKGTFSADDYVLALGPYSPILGRQVGLDLPIWPVKGFTASIPVNGHNQAPRVGIIEEDNLVAFAHLGNRLRIGGKADFAGYDNAYTKDDFYGVLKVAKDLFPLAGNYERARYWACLRPASAAGPPILGPSPVDNLYLNCGHGAAGWTMGCATSRAVADIICERQPEIDMEGLTLNG